MAEGTPKPHALTEEEVQEYITDYTKSAELAIEAGFDGIELHGARMSLPFHFVYLILVTGRLSGMAGYGSRPAQ